MRRTRTALTDAFLDLVVEKGYEKITVQEMLDRADIARSTFYAHYRDKEGVLLACFDDLWPAIAASAQTGRSIDASAQTGTSIDASAQTGRSIDLARPAEVLFGHAYRNKQVYRVLCGKQGGNVVLRYLHGVISQLLAETLGQHTTGSDLPIEIVAEFYTAAALGLLTWWIDHDFCHGPTWLTAAYKQLATRGAPISPE